MSRTSAPTLFFPVKLRLKPAPAFFTRRFEAQLHWQPRRREGCNETFNRTHGAMTFAIFAAFVVAIQ
jgi:hypothetical protein